MLKMPKCSGCAPSYFEVIARFFDKSQEALDFMRRHGVLPSVVECPDCDAKCSFQAEQKIWRCRQSTLLKDTKKRKLCDFSVSDYKDTFLHGSSVPPWKVVLFVNHWLSKLWDHSTVVRCLKISPATSHSYQALCYCITDHWFDNQPSVGGPGQVVELDKTNIHKKSEWAKHTTQICLFGGVERDTKKRFVVLLAGSIEDWQKESCVLPLVRRFVHSGSVVITDQSSVYNGLKDLGYFHFVVDTKRDSDPDVHTRNVSQLWKELKGWLRGPHLKTDNLYHELAKHLFVKTHKDRLLHHFFVHVGEVFPHQGGHHHTSLLSSLAEGEEDSEEDDEEL